MKFKILPHKFDDLYYFISPFSGNLVSSKSKPYLPKLNSRIIKNIHCNDNPYELDYLSNTTNVKLSDVNMDKLNVFNTKLLFLGNKRFLLSCFYSRIRVPLFQNTLLAFDHIAKLKIHKTKKGKICLQRSLLAAKTSKSFKKNGTLFIGAQLPTGIMHAWIIEDNIQPDRQDREWIMYKPLLAITF